MKTRDTAQTPVGENALGDEVISEKEQLLQAYFDGELSPADAKRFIEADPGAEQHAASFRIIRGELTTWMSTRCRDANGVERTPDLWGRINAELIKDAELGKKVQPREAALHVPFWESVQAALARFSQATVRPQFVGAFAVVVFIALSSTVYLRAPDEISDDMQTALRAPALVKGAAPNGGSGAVSGMSSAPDAGPDTSMSESAGITLAARSGSDVPGDAGRQGEDSASEVLVSEEIGDGSSVEPPFLAMRNEEAPPSTRGVRLAVNSSEGTPFERWVSLSIGNAPLLARDSEGSVSGGLRIDGVDIERIQSDRPVRFVASNGRKAPPVIWVARKGE